MKKRYYNVTFWDAIDGTLCHSGVMTPDEAASMAQGQRIMFEGEVNPQIVATMTRTERGV